MSSRIYSVNTNSVITDQADAESNKRSLILSFVVGITLFSMGLPLLIIGSISTAEDRLAMLIPGAILFVVGAFVTIVAAVKRATTSEQDIRQKLIRLEDIQIKQEIQEKKEEMSEQIKEKMEEVEEKLPEEIKEIESFQEIKSTVENTVESLDGKANQAIEEVMVESTEQMEQVQEKVLLSLEDSLSKLNDTLERLDKALMTKDRENIISELSGSQMNLNLTVDRIDNTIGYGIDEALRGGKTIVGNIEGIPHSVSIKVPESMNDFTSGLEKGQTIEQKVTLSTFNSVRKMLEFVIDK